MGLLYVFPVSADETDFVLKQDGKITIKSYGLPYIFWIYAICTVAMVFLMFLAVKAPVLKLVELGDQTDVTLGYTLLSLIGLSPLVIFSFFFYEKRFVKSGPELEVASHLFGIKVFYRKFQLEAGDMMVVDSFLSSPNVARINNTPEDLGFQNKGYFVLWLKTKQGKKIQLDRHSRKVDLEKLKDLLS